MQDIPTSFCCQSGDGKCFTMKHVFFVPLRIHPCVTTRTLLRASQAFSQVQKPNNFIYTVRHINIDTSVMITLQKLQVQIYYISNFTKAGVADFHQIQYPINGWGYLEVQHYWCTLHLLHFILFHFGVTVLINILSWMRNLGLYSLHRISLAGKLRSTSSLFLCITLHIMVERTRWACQ